MGKTDEINPMTKIKQELPAGISLVSAETFDEWFLDVQVLDNNPLYLDKTFRLLFKFGDQYPIGMMSPSCSPFPHEIRVTSSG